ncbi:MAG: hypothetical protein Q8M24_09905 [Pseudolabrys sp.]|nr:hypothetical protein [Pseudolabrys sp.]MDP2295761.1 hypothetical protein [Pseudolabrys sp.]
MQRFVLVIGGLAITATSFFGTLHFLDQTNFQSLDAIREEDAKALKAAIEKYRTTHGKYPSPYKDNGVSDLKAKLVDGGFIAKLPVDPYWKNGKVNKYRYRSDGSSFGLLFHLELGPCMTGIGPAATGPWDGQKIITCAF